MVQTEPERSRQMLLGKTAAFGPIRYSPRSNDLAPLLREGQARGQVHLDVDVAARTLSDTLMGQRSAGSASEIA